METIPSPQLGFLRGVFLANHLASTDNLTRTTKRQNTYNENKKKVSNKQQHNKKKHAKIWQTEPGLVAFYDIQPGNEAGLSLQPRSPHGAHTEVGLLLAHRNDIGWMSFLPPSVTDVGTCRSWTQSCWALHLGWWCWCFYIAVRYYYKQQCLPSHLGFKHANEGILCWRHRNI